MPTFYCQLCGQKIDGKGKTFRHPKWSRGMLLRVCPDCNQNLPRCSVCGLPMAAGASNGICKTCSQELRFCLACSKPLKGNFVELDGIGPYCRDCYRNRPPCDVCGAPLTNEQWQLSDGRRICVHCHTTAIYAPASATALYAEMKKLVAQNLGLSLNIPTGLALVDRNQLAEVIRKQTESNVTAGEESRSQDKELGLDPLRTLGLYARRGMRRGIYVQTGLPRLLFLQVAAHEYAHAWQGENCPLLRDILVHEGFAEWVSYHVLGYYQYSKGQQRMLKRNDIYGRGLRWALDLERKQGAGGVIQACRVVE